MGGSREQGEDEDEEGAVHPYIELCCLEGGQDGNPALG